MLTVRLAGLDDSAAIHRLAREVQAMHVAARPDIFLADGGLTEDELRARIAGRDHLHWIALADGHPAGYAFARLVVEPPSPLKHAARVLSLEELGVARATRGAGVGRALIGEVHAAARAATADRIVLSVWTFNDDAIRFYERSGFVAFQQRMALELTGAGPPVA